MSVSVLVKDAAELGEAPHWDADSKTLLYVDCTKGDVHRWDSLSQTDSKRHVADDSVSFMIPKQSGGYILGVGPNVVSLDWNTGEYTVRCTAEGADGTCFNDAKCDSTGRLWSGTINPKNASDRGKLYSFHNSALNKHLSNVGISNGIAWSTDYMTMYYIDSIKYNVYAYDFDNNSGSISNERILANFQALNLGMPDGMCIDMNSNLWVACFGKGKVVCVDTKTGSVLTEVVFPVSLTTSCCFGGEQLDELYVTSAKPGIPVFAKLNFPTNELDGSVFKVTGLGVKGSPGMKFSE